MTIFAPSRAARRPIARPIPREAPVMKSVLPARLMTSARQCQWRVVHRVRPGKDRLFEPACGSREVLREEAAERNPARMSGIRLALLHQPGGCKRRIRE